VRVASTHTSGRTGHFFYTEGEPQDARRGRKSLCNATPEVYSCTALTMIQVQMQYLYSWPVIVSFSNTKQVQPVSVIARVPSTSSAASVL
jgi:hypothetical protein